MTILVGCDPIFCQNGHFLIGYDLERCFLACVEPWATFLLGYNLGRCFLLGCDLGRHFLLGYNLGRRFLGKKRTTEVGFGFKNV